MFIQKIKVIVKNFLPYSLIIHLNKWRGYNYSEPASVVTQKINFYKTFLNEGDLVFDVGANYGNRVVPFLNLGTRVVAIEPLPDCVRYLKYAFGNKIQIENICVGSKITTSRLFVGKVNVISTLSTRFIQETIASGRFSSENWQGSIEVEVSTLDTLIQKHGLPKYIKIDTEGFELEVIKGLSAVVPILSFEYTLPEFKQDLIEILTLLNGRGNMSLNFIVGDQMTFVLNEWVTLEDFLHLVHSKPDAFNQWGDVFIKLNSN